LPLPSLSFVPRQLRWRVKADRFVAEFGSGKILHHRNAPPSGPFGAGHENPCRKRQSKEEKASDIVGHARRCKSPDPLLGIIEWSWHMPTNPPTIDLKRPPINNQKKQV
jgi:hypothetical protein